MISKATTSRSTLVIRTLAVLMFVGYFAARYDVYNTVKHLPHYQAKGSESAFFIGVLCNPIYFYCAGLWVLAGVFGRMKRGEAFTPAILADLKSLGICLIAGGVFGAIIFPIINACVSRTHFFAFQGVDVAIGLLGLVLLAVSRQGERLRGEWDQFV